VCRAPRAPTVSVPAAQLVLGLFEHLPARLMLNTNIGTADRNTRRLRR
jgi:hypothetical protein